MSNLLSVERHPKTKLLYYKRNDQGIVAEKRGGDRDEAPPKQGGGGRPLGDM